MRHAALRTVGIAALLAMVVLGACGDDGDDLGPDLGATGTTTSTTEPPAAGVTTTTAVAPTQGGTTVVPTTPPGTDLGAPTLDDASSVSTAGLDTVTFGMTLAQAEKAAGTRLLPDAAAPTTTDCAVVRPESGPAGVSFTISKGTIERVDIGAPAKIRTRSGAGLSTTVAQLQTLYGAELAAAPGTTTYVFTPVDAADAVYRVVFETDGTTVTALRAGRAALVTAAVSCS